MHLRVDNQIQNIFGVALCCLSYVDDHVPYRFLSVREPSLLFSGTLLVNDVVGVFPL
jgi:hypothetical protein